MFELRKAERKRAKLKLGVSGPSGSGKTYSALLIAAGLAKGDWSKVAIIDTENGSGEMYSGDPAKEQKKPPEKRRNVVGKYNVVTLEAPFSPRRYVDAIETCLRGGMEVIVIDSISHEWNGIGGCLDIQTKLGGKYQDWAKVTPQHNAFVQAILQSPVHVIVTMRKKQDYEMVNDGGKAKVTKMGLKEEQREGFEYELTINFDVEISHYATASKDRTGMFMSRPTFQITQETGREILEWSESGADAPGPLNVLPDKNEATEKPDNGAGRPAALVGPAAYTIKGGQYNGTVLGRCNADLLVEIGSKYEESFKGKKMPPQVQEMLKNINLQLDLLDKGSLPTDDNLDLPL